MSLSLLSGFRAAQGPGYGRYIHGIYTEQQASMEDSGSTIHNTWEIQLEPLLLRLMNHRLISAPPPPSPSSAINDAMEEDEASEEEDEDRG